MNSTTNKIKPISQQSGATLIVSLVILAIITMLGIASMRSSNLELKMAASARDRAVALAAAESALTTIERTITNTSNDFDISLFMPECSNGDGASSKCFKPVCVNGRCFGGDMHSVKSRDDCRLANNGRVTQYWSQSANWADDKAGKQAVLMKTEDGAPASQALYLIEFMCFVTKDENALDDPDVSGNFDVALYQITVRAQGEAKRASVMLQSVFKGAK